MAISADRGESAGFEQRRQPLTASDAHRHDAVALALALQLAQQVTCHARARHAEGVSDRDRAAVGVELFVRDVERRVGSTSSCEAKASFSSTMSMSFIVRPCRFEQLRHREGRANAHLLGATTRDGGAAIDGRAARYPARFALSEDIRSVADAPSESCEALPAVTVPLFLRFLEDRLQPGECPRGWSWAGCTRPLSATNSSS